MEELFHYMKTLRSQMNDVADQAAKISVEEHMHGTTIQTLQNDLDIVKNETRQVKEETVQMAKAKQQVNEKANGDKTEDFQKDVGQRGILDLNAAKANLDKLEQLKSNLEMENAKLRESADQLKSKMNCFKQELVKMDEKSLEEVLQALLSDKAGEYDYVQSLQLQIRKLTEISHKVRCSCEEEYNVELGLCA